MILALLCVAAPLAGAAWVAFGGRHGTPGGAVLAVAAVVLAASLAAAATRPPEAPPQYFGRYFVYDASAALFLAVIGMAFFGIAIAAAHPRSPTAGIDAPFAVRALLFLSACTASAVSNHMVGTWALLEAGSLIAAPLIHWRRGPAAWRASWRYLLFSVVGLGFNFVGLMCLARAMGGAHGEHTVTFFLDELQRLDTLGERRWWEAGLALMVFGLGAKLGLAPMYAWLPEAYDEAPPPVTTLLAAVQFNAALLFLLRQVALLRSFDPDMVSVELIAMGSLSILVSSLHLVRADNYKRMVAYASINHAGAIALGLGVGRQAAYGVVLYVVSNTMVKATLFLVCGNMKERYGTKRIADVRGLIRTMPYSGGAFMLGVFALLGFAPFGSFLGEVLILSGMAEGVHLAVFLFLCAALTVNLLATGRALFPMIWGEAADEPAAPRESFWSVAPAGFYVLALMSLGVYTPRPVAALLREVAATLGGG